MNARSTGQVVVAKKETKQAEKPRETTVEFLASLSAVLVTGLFIITFLVQAFEIPSSSMENTLLIGDHVFVNREQFAPATHWTGSLLPYRQIRRGDIVVFLSPAEPGLYVVKRIMGIPGDRIHLRDGVVYRNGEKLDEPYVIHKTKDGYNPYRDNFPAVPPADFNSVTPEWQLLMKQHIEGDDLVVPPDSYFGMGDNRDVSYDSRYWGFIPKENVIGRPMFIYWSFETPANQYLQKEVSERLKFLAHVVIHFFDETRWRARLQISRLSLTEPSLNLVRDRQGRWNLENLLERAAQIPVAPTKKASTEVRPGFPYIEADRGRINLKLEQEKKPYALMAADFALWQESENVWGMRLKAQPVRMDFNLTDTGTVSVNGSWQRAATLRQTPLQFTMEWTDAQLGQVSKLVSGKDQGWRGK